MLLEMFLSQSQVKMWTVISYRYTCAHDVAPLGSRGADFIFLLQHRWRSGARPRRNLRGQTFPHGIHDNARAPGPAAPSLLQWILCQVAVTAFGRGHRRRQQLCLSETTTPQAQAGPQYQAEHVIWDGQQYGGQQERERPRADRR